MPEAHMRIANLSLYAKLSNYCFRLTSVKRHNFSMSLGNMMSFFVTLLVSVCNDYILAFKKICLSFPSERDLQ